MKANKTMDLSRYYEEICREPLLSKEEEEDLFLELSDIGLPERKRKEIRDRIIRSNLRFVFRQAKYFSKNDPDLFNELISAGNEGLLVGMEKYDTSRGMRFLTYAGFWVKQRILNQMAKMRIVSLPIWKQQLATKIQRYCDSHENVTLKDLVEAFPDNKPKDIQELFKTRYLTFYIDDIGEDPAFEVNPIEHDVETRIDVERIHSFVDSLEEPHKSVIELFFGIKDGQNLKLSDISEKLGIPKEKLKEIKKEALSILRSKLESQ